MTEENKKYILLVEINSNKKRLIETIDKLIIDFETNNEVDVYALSVNRITTSSIYPNPDRSLFCGISMEVKIR